MRQWANLGYPRRALWLHRAAVEIRDRHGGVVPRDVDALLALSGIGDYTARAVAVFAYGDRHPVVDTNTRRVLARAVDGRSQPGPPARARPRRDGRRCCPRDDADAAIVNAATMELGATVCTARAPRCDACPIAHACAWRAAGYPDTGDDRRRQARYEGSDRQARGAVLKALRDAAAPGIRSTQLLARLAGRAASATARSPRSPTTGSSSSRDRRPRADLPRTRSVGVLGDRESRHLERSLGARPSSSVLGLVFELARLHVRVGVAGVLQRSREPRDGLVPLARFAQQSPRCGPRSRGSRRG